MVAGRDGVVAEEWPGCGVRLRLTQFAGVVLCPHNDAAVVGGSVASRYGVSPDVVERGLFRILTGYARMLRGENSWPPALVKTRVARAFRA